MSQRSLSLKDSLKMTKLLVSLAALFIIGIIAQAANAYSAGQVFVPGGSGLMSCSTSRSNKGFGALSRDCSPLFYQFCYPLRSSNITYFPNCIGSDNEKGANKSFNDYLEYLQLQSLNASKAVQGCMADLIPLICNTFYPFHYKSSYLAPCIDHCLNIYSKCQAAGVDVSRSEWSCGTLFNDNCPAVRNRDISCIRPCHPPKIEPPSCFKECKGASKTMKVCTKKDRKCSATNKQVKVSISGKQFTFKNFKFGKSIPLYIICFTACIFQLIKGAKVQVLEQVHLCEPKNAIAYKVKVLHDYFLDCKLCQNISQEVSSKSIMYVLTTDSIEDCEERCIEDKLEINETYFIMGQLNLHYTTQCGMKVWELDRGKRRKSVIYPWNKAMEDKADRKKTLFRHAKDNFVCKWPCQRSSMSCQN